MNYSQAYLSESDGLIQTFLNNCTTTYDGDARCIEFPNHVQFVLQAFLGHNSQLKLYQLSQFVRCPINSNLNNLDFCAFQANDQTDVGEWQRVQLPELFPSIAFACSARVVFAA